MICWSLQWEHWGECDDFWCEIFYTRRAAIDHAVFTFYEATDENRIMIGRSNLWRRLRRKGLRVVKVRVVRE